MRKENVNQARQVVELVQSATVVQRNVTMDDEVYDDLRIWGDDLYDIFSTLADRFGTDFSALCISDYAPGEGVSFVRPLLRLFGARPFKSLKVRDIVAAVEAGSWKKRNDDGIR